MRIKTYSLGSCMANCYIASAGNTALVIDPAAEGKTIAAALQKQGLTPAAVLLTHGHVDHIFGLGELLDAAGDMPVYIHEADVPYLHDPMLNLSVMIEGVPYTFDGKVNAAKHGDVLDIGTFDVRVIHTPGHTDGSSCYLVTDKENGDTALFSGDTLFGGTVGRTDFPHGDYDTLMQSLEKLTVLPDELDVYPGHMGATTIGHEKRYNMYLS